MFLLLVHTVNGQLGEPAPLTSFPPRSPTPQSASDAAKDAPRQEILGFLAGVKLFSAQLTVRTSSLDELLAAGGGVDLTKALCHHFIQQNIRFKDFGSLNLVRPHPRSPFSHVRHYACSFRAHPNLATRAREFSYAYTIVYFHRRLSRRERRCPNI